MVYEHREDSILLLDATLKEIYSIKKRVGENIKRIRFLDMGTGSGFITEQILRAYNEPIDITASDIDKKAIEECKKRIDRIKQSIKQNVQEKTRIKIIHSDLFNNITGVFHIVVFNAPYLPRGIKPLYESYKNLDDSMSDYISVIGGKKGYETILRFLEQLPEHLHENGVCLITYSSLSKPHIIEQEARKRLLDIKVINKKRMFFETLFVARITKTKLLQELNHKNLKHVYLLYKGKHSNVYKAVRVDSSLYKHIYSNTQNINTQDRIVRVIKVSLKGFEDNIKKEFMMLRYLNKLSNNNLSSNTRPKHSELNVPNVYMYNKNWFEMDFLEGSNLGDFLQTSAKKGFESKNKVVDVLIKILRGCYTLDVEGIVKEEMHRPDKHIIIVEKKSKLSPYFIDFERAHKGKPHNVTQFCQYLIKTRTSNNLEKIGIRIHKKAMIKACRYYKRVFDTDLREDSFKAILDLIS